jgi:hypothetical protein
MKSRMAAFVLPVAIGLAACSDDPVSPEPEPGATLAEEAMAQAQAALADAQQIQQQGSGLVLESLTGLTLPLIGLPLGDVVIDEAVITRFAIIENVVGAIVGIEVEGLLQLSGGVLGTDVVTEDFRTLVSVASSGPFSCRLIGIDFGPITLDALGEAVSVDVPVATVNTGSAGVVGILLCLLGRLLETTITDPIAAAVRFIVNVLNFLLI